MIILTKKIMGSIKNRRSVLILIACAVFLDRAAGLYAQDAGMSSAPQVPGQIPQPGQLGGEIQSLERKLTDTGISPAEKYDALTRLARLRQLSGDIDGAAANWLEAAAVLSDKNGEALVAAVYCLAAVGEWEKAAAVLQHIAPSDRSGPLMFQVRYLDAFLKAWNGDSSALTALTADPEFAGMRPGIYYTLWRTAGSSNAAGAENAESWRARLLAEFPNSPEARLVNPDAGGASPSVSAVQRPLWLLLPVNTPDISEPSTPSAGPVTPARPAAPENTNPVPVNTAPAYAAPASAGPVLQTGLFGSEANARGQAERLQKAGFTAIISGKTVNGAEHWIVTVPAGQDPNRTALDLKRAGFDSFLVRN